MLSTATRLGAGKSDTVSADGRALVSYRSQVTKPITITWRNLVEARNYICWISTITQAKCVCVCVCATPTPALSKWQTVITDWSTDTQTQHSWVLTPHLASDQPGSRLQALKELQKKTRKAKTYSSHHLIQLFDQHHIYHTLGSIPAIFSGHHVLLLLYLTALLSADGKSSFLLEASRLTSPPSVCVVG